MDILKKNDSIVQAKQSILANYCSIKNTNKGEFEREILFLQQKYEKIKNKLHQKKLIGNLNQQDIQQIGNLMNIVAMKYSQQGKNDTAEQWLKRALKHGQISQRVRIVTFNNLACVYKQASDLALALLYIKKAQKEADLLCLEMTDNKLIKVVTDCSLNLCAILSSMGEHYKALRAARKALDILKSSEGAQNNYYNSLYPFAKYNQAVELERLQMYKEAKNSYDSVISSQGLTEQLRDRVQQAITQINVKISANKEKKLIIRKPSKQIKLSLPKFCLEENKEEQKVSYKNNQWRKKKRNSEFFNDKEFGKIKQYQTLNSQKKQNRLGLQIYQSPKISGRIRKNVLLSIQNF